MFVAVIKCDFCKITFEAPCRKAGEKPEIPEGWASVVPMIHIKGSPKLCSYNGKLWNAHTRNFDIEPTPTQKLILESKGIFAERTKKLRAQFDKSHVCVNCVEQILTGMVSLKISHERA